MTRKGISYGLFTHGCLFSSQVSEWPFVGALFLGLLCLDMMILAASIEGQEFEAKSKRRLAESELELLGLVLILFGCEKGQ